MNFADGTLVRIAEERGYEHALTLDERRFVRFDFAAVGVFGS